MRLEDILDFAEPQTPFWVKAWIFLFTLINRKEGKRLIEEFISKQKESIAKQDAIQQRINELNKEADESLRIANERLDEARQRVEEKTDED